MGGPRACDACTRAGQRAGTQAGRARALTAPTTDDDDDDDAMQIYQKILRGVVPEPKVRSRDGCMHQVT